MKKVRNSLTWFSHYAEGEPWKPFCPPDDGMFLNTLLHTKDSAPGPDGLPYSAWRLLPKVTVEAMKSCFLDIINGTALPPHQVGVWIPKAKIGPEADCFRPLGMPNTLERLVDGSVAAQAMRQTAHTMHPSQAVMSCFKEPQKAVSCIQKILDGDTAAMALLADLSKAFERVNPYWILELLRIRRAPITKTSGGQVALALSTFWHAKWFTRMLNLNTFCYLLPTFVSHAHTLFCPPFFPQRHLVTSIYSMAHGAVIETFLVASRYRYIPNTLGRKRLR